MECGEITPEDVHVPGIFVQRIIKGTDYIKRIEVRLLNSRVGLDALICVVLDHVWFGPNPLFHVDESMVL